MARHRITANMLITEWGVKAEQGYYSKDSKFYNLPSVFPSALFNTSGFILFESEASFKEYIDRKDIVVSEGKDKKERIKVTINVKHPGIQSLKGYKTAPFSAEAARVRAQAKKNEEKE